MSSIIQTVSFSETESKSFNDKIAEHLGVHHITIYLKNDDTLGGIVSEVGKDYLIILDDKGEIVIPVKNIKYFRYST